MKKIVPLLVLATLASGCSTMVKEKNVVVVDPIEQERKILEREGKIGRHDIMAAYERTPPHVIIADKDNIVVTVDKAPPLEDNDGVEQEVWEVFAENKSSTAGQCVTVLWRLMDFEYTANDGSEVYVPKHAKVHMGTMYQKIWELDGVRFAPPASGYAEKIRVRAPIADAKSGEECAHIVEDKKDIKEE